MSAAKILLTADDFGRSAEVNAAIIRWARAGALTQASLMVNEPGAEAAIALAKEVPSLRIGLHLTLCDGRASDGGALPATPAVAGLQFAFWPAARERMRKEVRAQFRRFAELGLSPTYWDGHTHLHLHPSVMAVALPLAEHYGFRATRLVREPGRPGLLPWIFQKLSQRAVPRLDAAGIRYTDAVFGLRNTGRMSRADFAAAVEWASRGSVEVYFHPGAESRLPEPDETLEILNSGSRE